MHDFATITELELVKYASHGLCAFILKAPPEDLYRLNEQYSELHERRKAIDEFYKRGEAKQ